MLIILTFYTFVIKFYECFPDANPEETISKCHSFFCCLRRYRGLSMNGFGVTEKKISYLPCQLTTRFKEVKFNHEANSPPCIFLVVTAQAASSAYKCECFSYDLFSFSSSFI